MQIRTTMNEIEKLLEQWNTLTPDQEEQFLKDSVNDFKNKSEEGKKEFLIKLENSTNRVCEEADELIELLTIRQQLEPIVPYISLSTIAKEYLGKSRNWLYQRINGNLVNGKPAKFTTNEKAKLKEAINDIIGKLQNVSISLN